MFSRIYGVYDRKANELVGPLMLFGSDGVAVREIRAIVQEPGNVLRRFAADYVLVRFGVFGCEDDSELVRIAEVERSEVIELLELVSDAERTRPAVQADASPRLSVSSPNSEG